MAYKALYRSYRPQTFKEVAGQEHIIKTLENAVHTKKIAHAYLFAGPRGPGKTTIAKIFAKAINCGESNAPCGECEICNSIMTGEHPDVIEIDAASNNGVDEVRDLIDKVKYAPINGKYKVYIIDEVHMMTTGAFNALLKTLEEPPAHAVFILATTEPHKILPTIISRCQRFDFTKVEERDIIKRLEYVLLEENMPINDQALKLIARLAEGGMRDALSILEQCLAFDTKVTEDTVNQIYGLISTEKKIEFIKKLLAKDMKSVLSLVDDMLSSSIDIKRLTFDIIDILKDIVIYKNTQDDSVLFILSKDNINEIVPYILVEEAFSMIDILIEASNKYNQSLNAKIYFELAMLKICNQVKEGTKEVIVEQQTETLVAPIQTTQELIVEKEPEINELDTSIETMEEIEVVKEPETTNESVTVEDSVLEELEAIINDEPILEESIVEEEQVTEPTENTTTITSPTVDIEVMFDDILNILVQADRNILNEIKEKWEVISRYRYNLNTAKLASMLCDGKPVAAGNKAIIISFEHQPMVNDVNYSVNYFHLKQFLKEVLGEAYDFVAVKENDWSDIRQKYIALHKQQSLPEAKEIILHHIKEVKEEKKDTLNKAQQFAVEMFGKDIVEFED
ncbi:MAG: DNA polymerase III subunit gamma/tau [Coprobacillaceae bacterium]